MLQMGKMMTQESDKISQLPRHITDEILRRLPIKDAVRTSALSRKWRYKWCSIPYLRFDDQCTRACGGFGYQSPQDLVKIIDQVLLLHTGPILTFILHHTEFFPGSNIDPWILHLSRASLKRIVLTICAGQKYKIPTSLFHCRDLVLLKLYGCSVKIPASFQGFKSLTTLYLHCVELSPSGLEALVSGCPLLKRLALKSVEGITQVDLKAHDLESLDIRGAFVDVAFGVTNSLKSVTVGFDDNSANIQGPGSANTSDLCKFFLDIHNIQILRLENYSVKVHFKRIRF